MSENIPAKGRRAAYYEATMPNGEKITKYSFVIDSSEALLGCFFFNGHWFASGIVAEAHPEWNQEFVKALRIR